MSPISRMRPRWQISLPTPTAKVVPQAADILSFTPDMQTHHLETIQAIANCPERTCENSIFDRQNEGVGNAVDVVAEKSVVKHYAGFEGHMTGVLRAMDGIAKKARSGLSLGLRKMSLLLGLRSLLFQLYDGISGAET
ncbi:hexokinase hxk2 protein [Diaporthe amygdali]|uniref:hexokinase hxk2 protein n=1 Tax=Phomopsis amygdali TaxID=1214568 RepID=UPI0022FEA95E|nr:hexokinase hxk2 protein [Diaporthe amygdali]KAJ0107804.1 hexokinase hxk2 protein [Diaporthe amygdali]